MAVTPVVDAEIRNSIFEQGFKLASYAELLTATKVITVDYPPVLILDPNAATRNVDLPAEALSKGLCFFILNDGAGIEILVIRNDAAATIITLDFPDNGWVYCDGTAWRGIVSKGIT